MLHTADLCDKYFPDLQLAAPGLLRFGGKRLFSGEIETLRVYEDSALIKAVIGEAGNGKVLVIDGGGSFKRALTGDMMAAKASANGWSGLVFNGCIRDADEIADLDIGVLALGSCPVKPDWSGEGDRGVEVRFNGVRFTPGHFLYADGDGVVVSATALNLDA